MLQQISQILQQQQQVLPPVAPLVEPVAPTAPVVPEEGRAEDGLLKQFINLNASTFSGTAGEDPREFLREMDKHFRLMAYGRPRKVEMVEFMLRGLAQV